MTMKSLLAVTVMVGAGLSVLAQGPRRVALGDWPEMRGPSRDGLSRETGLIDKWQLNGENFLWRVPHGGRSAPIVMGNHVYVQNPAGRGEALRERVTEELSARLGIRPGQTDAAGMFTLVEVECLGACDRAPVVMVNDDWHERLSPDQAGRLIDDIKAQGTGALTGCYLHKEKS